MPVPNFTARVTAITAAWLNPVSNVIFGLLGDGTNAPTTVAQIQAALGITASGAVPKKIVIIGDSLSSQNSILHEAWPSIMQRYMAALGMPVNIISLALDACSFYRAVTGFAGFYFGANTIVQEAIAQAPDIVLVMLGFNDAIYHVDGRNLATIEADAAALFTALRTGLPSAKIIFCSEVPYDTTNFTPATLKNASVVPFSFCLPTAGILTNCYSSEILTNTIASQPVDIHGNNVTTDYTNWASFDAYVKGLGTIDTSINVNYYRIARVGGIISPDFIHPSEMGSILEAGYILKGLRATAFFAAFWPKAVANNFADWNDPDVLFGDLLTFTAGAYVNNYNSSGESVILQNGIARQLHPDSWYLPYHSRFSLSPTSGSNDDQNFFSWSLFFGPPNAPIYISIDGGSFNAYGYSSSPEGAIQALGDMGGLNLANGAHTIRYRAVLPNGTQYESYGPFTFTLAAPAVPFLRVRRTSNQAMGGAGTFTNISFNTVDSDNRSGYSGGTYTVPVQGKYQVNTVLALSGVTSDDWGQLLIYKNGARHIDGLLNYNAGPTSPGYMGTIGGAVIDCAAGDTISVYYYNNNSAGPPNAIPGTNNTASMMTIKWVGN